MSENNPKFDPQRADAKNPNNNAFWQSRGYPDRPKNWKKLLDEIERPPTSSKTRKWKQNSSDWEVPGIFWSDEY